MCMLTVNQGVTMSSHDNVLIGVIRLKWFIWMEFWGLEDIYFACFTIHWCLTDI